MLPADEPVAAETLAFVMSFCESCVKFAACPMLEVGTQKW